MIRVLVDTHAVLWWLADDRRLSADARNLIAAPGTTPLVSIASLWEIAIKRSLGKLGAPDDLPERIRENGFSWLALAAEHVWAVADLPDLHQDPFDRALVAQANVEGIPIVTVDPRFAAYGVDVRW